MNETVNETVENVTTSPLTIGAIGVAAISTIAAIRFRRQRNKAMETLGYAVAMLPEDKVKELFGEEK